MTHRRQQRDTTTPRRPGAPYPTAAAAMVRSMLAAIPLPCDTQRSTRFVQPQFAPTGNEATASKAAWFARNAIICWPSRRADACGGTRGCSRGHTAAWRGPNTHEVTWKVALCPSLACCWRSRWATRR